MEKTIQKKEVERAIRLEAVKISASVFAGTNMPQIDDVINLAKEINAFLITENTLN